MASVTMTDAPSSTVMRESGSVLSSMSSSVPLELGPEGLPDPATAGYISNHIALRARNWEAMLEFYTKALGMRHIFSLAVSPKLNIAYVGHDRTNLDGWGPQTVSELLANRSKMQGLIKLIGVPVSASGHKLAGDSPSVFSHIGVTVPNVEATQARLEQLGVTIVKHAGDDVVAGSFVARSYGIDEDTFSSLDELQETVSRIHLIGIRDFLVVADPDGNLVEIQQRDDDALNHETIFDGHEVAFIPVRRR